MAIYEKVKEACTEKGISVSALEQQLGFARSSICKWNTNTPGVDKVKAVAEALEKPMEYFVTASVPVEELIAEPAEVG